jgi:hypothetical protein
MTRICLQELYEPVSLLDRNLGKFAVFVENMEHVSFGDSFGRKVAYT